jgi:hypothetical protein
MEKTEGRREGAGGRDQERRREREHTGASEARPSVATRTHSPTAVRRKRSRSPLTSGIRQRARRGGGGEEEDEPEEKKKGYSRNPAAGHWQEECLYLFPGERDSKRDE